MIYSTAMSFFRLFTIPRWILMTLLFCTVSFGAEPNATQTKSPASLTWEADTLEFKPEPGAKEVRGAFHFKNQTQTTITISRATPNCSCLKVLSFSEETAPGK